MERNRERDRERNRDSLERRSAAAGLVSSNDVVRTVYAGDAASLERGVSGR